MNIRSTEARSILTPVSGFLAEAGFTHSLTPARNCTYGCSYCYVPSMRIFGGLQPEDWKRWGQFTTFKTNAADLLSRSKLENRIVYCSPLVDPYQPAESQQVLMRAILTQLRQRPPETFVIQTRGTLIVRDIALLQELSRVTKLRISFSITTNRKDVERRYEARCEPNSARLAAIRRLNEAGLETYAALAPLLPCDPEELALEAMEASGRRLIGDPLHVRESKRHGATTRPAAFAIAECHNEQEWFHPPHQQMVVDTIRKIALAHRLDFATGPKGFSWLTQ